MILLDHLKRARSVLTWRSKESCWGTGCTSDRSAFGFYSTLLLGHLCNFYGARLDDAFVLRWQRRSEIQKCPLLHTRTIVFNCASPVSLLVLTCYSGAVHVAVVFASKSVADHLSFWFMWFVLVYVGSCQVRGGR